MESKQITSLIITKNIAATETLVSFQETINVPFTPDKIIVSNIYYEAVNEESILYKIRSNLITSLDSVIGITADKVQMVHAMTFNNDRTISGSYNFDVTSLGFEEGIFTMTLTFIKN